MGRTSDDSYKTLMIQRWKMLPNLVKENLGSNIVWLDLDCVFNKTQNTLILSNQKNVNMSFGSNIKE